MKTIIPACFFIILFLLASFAVGIESTAWNETGYWIYTTGLIHNSTRVFTWVSHNINESTANWLSTLSFTDVATRYMTPQELAESKQSLASYSIRLWSVVGPWLGWDAAVAEYPVLTESLIIDDCHAIFNDLSDSQRRTFIAGLERYGNNVILVFYAPESIQYFRNYNFTGLNVDLYCSPAQLNETLIADTKTLVKSLGLYLWIWKGWGYTWETVTQQEVEYAYSLAEQFRMERFTVWMGSEPNKVEAGMVESSLINYPSWFLNITKLNMELKK